MIISLRKGFYVKLVIAGSRHLDIFAKDIVIFTEIIGLPLDRVSEIVSGGCPTGADEAAKLLAKTKKKPFKEFPADWEKHGKRAGPVRNHEMAAYGDALLLIWDGESRGSANMRYAMKCLDKPVYEIVIKKP